MSAVSVTSLEIALLTAIIALATLIQIYATFKIVQISTSTLVQAVQQLDSAIAEAISSVVEQGVANFEPPNPIVGLITEYMKQNMQSPNIQAQVLQGEDGKFVKKKE